MRLKYKLTTKPFIHLKNLCSFVFKVFQRQIILVNFARLIIIHLIGIRFHRVGVRHSGSPRRGARRGLSPREGAGSGGYTGRAITSGPRRDTRISIINFVRARDGVLRPPPVRVKPGSSPSLWLALGTPLRQWPPAALNVSDDVWGPPSGRRSATVAVLIL